MNAISACLITLNEEKNLARALVSLQGVADEIVVVDACSTDTTIEIARQHGAVVHVRPWTNYSDQRNFAAAQARHEWILVLDADEELSYALAESLRAWKELVPAYDAYEFSRLTWYLGAWIRHSGWYPGYLKRLYRRDTAQFSGIIHEALRTASPVGRLRGDLHHFTVRSYAEHTENVEHYSTLGAEQMLAAGRRRWLAAMLFTPVWSWLRCYVLQAGFLDGHRGWLIARMAALSAHLKYRKLGRLIRGAKESKSRPSATPGASH